MTDTKPQDLLSIKWTNKVTEFDGDPAFDRFGHFDLEGRFLPNAIIDQIIELLRPLADEASSK